jgi:hypothetical protein
MAQKFTLYYYVKVWIIVVHDYVIFNAFQVIQRFLKQQFILGEDTMGSIHN